MSDFDGNPNTVPKIFDLNLGELVVDENSLKSLNI
jgi:hypothetical protein